MPKNLILSPSGIGLYNSCPYSFKLRYIDHCKSITENDSALRLGKSVHAVLENYYKNINLKTDNPDIELVEAFKKTAKERWDCSIDAKKRDEMNTHMFLWLQFEIQRFKRYKELNILDKFCPVTVEEDITDYSNKIRAIIDKRCIGQTGNTYCIDYKTDKKLPAERNFSGDLSKIDDKYKVQSALNAMVLKTKDVKLDNFFFQFIRYPNKLLSVPITPELFTEINTLITKIRNTTEFVKNKKNCFYCGMKIYCKTESSSIHCMTTEIL
jgi:CRISPR/Cas system-associated exonuclease Cas4 (RecB family)